MMKVKSNHFYDFLVSMWNDIFFAFQYKKKLSSYNYLNILTSLLQNCHKCRRNNVKIFENIVSLGWKFLLNPFTTWDIAWWLFVMRGLSHPFRATLTLVASAFPKNVYAKIIALKTCNWPNKLLLRLFHLIHRKWAKYLL